MTQPDTNERRNRAMKAAEMRAAQMAIARSPEARAILTDAMEGLQLASAVLDAWEGADAPCRALVRRYAPVLGAALDALETGPRS